ncbi:hypothetical protein PR048_003343 [Dryococelus australis]|uniref:Uncharacterized protein n=1 Tax=Dryococelus australis TaxID=614101 RepID=A0ABQ9IPU7_9NEOP|nr:hypothetical protein PR048_003343 [Dryococelus australis]
MDNGPQWRVVCRIDAVGISTGAGRVVVAWPWRLPEVDYCVTGARAVVMEPSVQEDCSWVLDSIVGFLQGPIWNAPVLTFIEHKSSSKSCCCCFRQAPAQHTGA